MSGCFAQDRLFQREFSVDQIKPGSPLAKLRVGHSRRIQQLYILKPVVTYIAFLHSGVWTSVSPAFSAAVLQQSLWAHLQAWIHINRQAQEKKAATSSQGSTQHIMSSRRHIGHSMAYSTSTIVLLALGLTLVTGEWVAVSSSTKPHPTCWPSSQCWPSIRAAEYATAARKYALCHGQGMDVYSAKCQWKGLASVLRYKISDGGGSGNISHRQKAGQEAI
jgi:hypothetical protein